MESRVFCVSERDNNGTTGDWGMDDVSDDDWDLTSLKEMDIFFKDDPDSNTNLTIATTKNTTLADLINNGNSVEELLKKNIFLEEQWKNMERKCLAMQKENERVNQILSEERYRSSKYQQKLKYIQDNHEIFERLKQAYLSMKYNESCARPLVEIKETGCQTWSERPGDALAEGPGELDILDTLDHLHHVTSGHSLKGKRGRINVAADYIALRRKDLESVKETVQILKETIMNQPMLTENREEKYRKDIAVLVKENRNLKQQIIDKQLELDTAKRQVASKKNQKESSMLRKIIAKLEKQLKNLDTKYENATSGDSLTDLNDRERKIIEHITTKYETKLKLKLESTYPSPNSTFRDRKKTSTPYFTPRTPKEAKTKNLSDSESPRTFRSCEDDGTLDLKDFDAKGLNNALRKVNKNVQNTSAFEENNTTLVVM